MKIRNIIMGLAIIALPNLFVACSDDDVKVSVNDTSKPSVTGEAISIGLTKASIEAYFNEDVLTQQYATPKYGIEYSTSSDFSIYETRTKSANDIVGRKYTVTLTDLSPSTTYYYRSYVILSGDNRYLGQTKSFNTNQLKNIVSSISATDVTLTEATIKGQIDTKIYNDDNNHEAYKIGFIYSTKKEEVKEDGNYDYKEWSPYAFDYGDTMWKDWSGAFEYKFSGLPIGTTYYYASYTRINDTYAFSSVKSFKTAESVSGSIALANATDVTYTKASLSATLNVNEDYLDDPYVSYYRIEYKESGTDKWERISAKREDKVLTASLKNLIPNTTYSYRAVIALKNGSVALTSAEKSFKTKVLTGSVTIDKIQGITSRHAAISATLNLPSDAFTDNIYCTLYYGRLQTSESNWQTMNMSLSSNPSANINGLTPNTQYGCNVKILDAKGNPLMESSTKSFKTIDEVVTTYEDWHTYSSGTHTWNFAVKAGDVLTFNYKSTGEYYYQRYSSVYDKLAITLDGTNIVNSTSSTMSSYSHTFTTSGTVTMIANFTKNASSKQYEAGVYNVTITQ